MTSNHRLPNDRNLTTLGSPVYLARRQSRRKLRKYLDANRVRNYGRKRSSIYRQTALRRDYRTR